VKKGLGNANSYIEEYKPEIILMMIHGDINFPKENNSRKEDSDFLINTPRNISQYYEFRTLKILRYYYLQIKISISDISNNFFLKNYLHNKNHEVIKNGSIENIIQKIKLYESEKNYSESDKLILELKNHSKLDYSEITKIFNIYKNRKDYQGCVSLYDWIENNSKLSKTNGDILNNAGTCHLKINNSFTAESIFKKCINETNSKECRWNLLRLYDDHPTLKNKTKQYQLSKDINARFINEEVDEKTFRFFFRKIFKNRKL
ncbi:hypothetical protein KY334_00090, partial [Candidatus Woesearchaeota archaeon]|nr:hypothetical protein [Candidatus Woesearchaeota archaeon]